MGYNYLGKSIGNKRMTDAELTAKHTFLNKKGNFDWPEDDGFDSRYGIAGVGYKVPIELPAGKWFARYGNNGGKLMADRGVPYELLGLPYKKELKEYHEYILEQTITIEEYGYIAAVFDSPGGVPQYRVKDGVQHLIDLGILREDEEWLRKIRKKK